MAGWMGKTPRHHVTDDERQLCLDALVNERRARGIRRAEEKECRQAADKKTKETRKKAVKLTTADMGRSETKENAVGTEITANIEIAEAKETTGGREPAEGAAEANETAASQEVTVESEMATVEEVIVDMVTAGTIAEKATTVRSPPVANPRKRRRAILQEGSEDDESEESGRDGDATAVENLRTLLPCVVDGDANIMNAGAEKCTYLNSDEDLLLQEEHEDEDDSDFDEDDWVEDWDIGELTNEDSEDEGEALPESVCNSIAQSKKATSAMRTLGWEYDSEKFGPDPTYEDLYKGPYGPSDSVMAVGDDPFALLFYFMPPKLWTQIAAESNRYHSQSIPLRARAIRSQQRRNGLEVEDLGDIRSRLARVPDIEPWEVLRVMGLLIARMLMPIWKVTEGKRQSSVKDSTSRGYSAPPVISFDEATLPSRSRYNPTRQFNKDKPHKRGTKVFVATCAKTVYSLRIEIYCGAKTNLQTPVPKDNNTGEAAVLKNMNTLCPPSKTSSWRLVVTDRFYTSVRLALELLHRRMYLTGTTQTDRSGYAKGVVTKKETKFVNKHKIVEPPHGTIKLAQNKRFPQITAAMWMDRNPVHLLLSGGSRSTGIVMRRIHGEKQPVPTPELLCDYHRWMGGVDVHDQLRMQRYSVQLCYKTPKYYKTLFLGLLDMALVNAFIVFRQHKKVNDKRPPKHYALFETLMVQLLAVDSAETYEAIESATTARERTATSPAREEATQIPVVETADCTDGRHLEENPGMVDNDQGLKQHQRSCKVCAVYKTKPRKYSKYFCPECSTGNRRKYFCEVARGRAKTCFAIWHEDWNNGNDIPRTLLQERKLRDPGTCVASRQEASTSHSSRS